MSTEYAGFELRPCGVIPGLGMGEWVEVTAPDGTVRGYTGPGSAEMMLRRGAVFVDNDSQRIR